MPKRCPNCGTETGELAGKWKGWRVDFSCQGCGAALQMDARLMTCLTVIAAVPSIFCSDAYFPTFTFLIGDLLIFLFFGFLFSPLRRVRLRTCAENANGP